MVVSCAAWDCTNRFKKKEHSGSVRFLSFPLKDKERLGKWLTAMKREDFDPTIYCRICSDHFKKEDFFPSIRRQSLRKTAIPSVFNFPEHLQTPSPKKRRAPLPRHTDADLRRHLNHDHGIYTETPSKASNKRQKKTMRELKLRRKVHNLQQKSKRNKLKHKRLKNLIRELRDKNLIEERAYEMLDEAFGDTSMELFQHLVRLRKTKRGGERYNSKVSNFALSLYFISPRAYNFIRPILKLPSVSTLRLWRSSVDCKPGYLDEVFRAIHQIVDTDESLAYCTLVLDEMALRKGATWNAQDHIYTGFMDYGGGPIGENLASNALVFMLVGIKGRWKAPIAYFLTDHINSELLSTLVKEALCKCAEQKLKVMAVVADGLSANKKAAKTLGCNISALSPETSFPHPHPDCTDNVYFICDAVHMLKLMRNTLAQRHTLKYHDSLIEWKYIEELHKLQEKDSLYLANKLSSTHINFHNLKMKVALAAQTLSESVATAIDFLRDDIKLEQFQNSEATCQFIRKIDTLFDLLNSRNPCAKGKKAALSEQNRETWETTMDESVEYLRDLQEKEGTPLYAGRLGTGVTGLIVTTISTKHIANQLLQLNTFDYLLTYKLSQDHLEMFFSKVRARGGFNNNPNTTQFQSAMRSLVINNSIKSSQYANAIDVDREGGDDDNVHLQFSRTRKRKHLPDTTPLNDLEFNDQVSQLDATLTLDDTDWRQNCLVYTAGYVVRQVEKQTKCVTCKSYLIGDGDQTPTTTLLNFLRRKNKGGLKTPSIGVVKVITCAESAFRLIMPDPSGMKTLPYQKDIDIRMQALVISRMRPDILDLFPQLSNHFFEHELMFEEDHISTLVRRIVSFYLRMRLHKAAIQNHKRAVLKGGASRRMKSNKVVLFSGE